MTNGASKTRALMADANRLAFVSFAELSFVLVVISLISILLLAESG